VRCQKARLARLHQSKLAARRAVADGTRRFDEWQRRCGLLTAASTDRRDALTTTTSSVDVSDALPLAKKDLFELQHFHLLRCLEHAAVYFYTVIHNYGNPYEKWNIFVARPHLRLQLGMVKPEIMLCETVLNLSTLNTLTYLRTY